MFAPAKMDKLSLYLYQVISGELFKKILGNEANNLIKFMNNDDVHYGMRYVTGLNKDVLPFNPEGECSKGGIYFCHLSNYHHWYSNYGDFVRRVEIPDDAQIYVENRKIKADKVVLSKKDQKDNVLRQLFSNYALSNSEETVRLIKRYSWTIQFINRECRTIEMMIEAVKKNGLAISFIDQEFRTLEMMLIAVKQNGWSIEYIDRKYRTPEMIEISNRNRPEC